MHHAVLRLVFQLVLHAGHGHRIGLRHLSLHIFQALPGRIDKRRERIILHQTLIRLHRLRLEARAHLVVGAAQHPQRLIGRRIDRVLIHNALQTVRRRRVRTLGEVETRRAHLAFGFHFLNVTEQLLHTRRELGIRPLDQQLAALVFGAEGMLVVAIRLLHLAQMDRADLLLRFGGFLHGRVEQDEILVLRLGLRQAVGTAFAHPTVGDRQFGLRQEFAGVVGVDERVQRQPGHFVAATFDVGHGLVEENFIGLLRVFADRVFILLLPETTGERGHRHHRRQRQHTNFALHDHVNNSSLTQFVAGPFARSHAEPPRQRQGRARQKHYSRPPTTRRRPVRHRPRWTHRSRHQSQS